MPPARTLDKLISGMEFRSRARGRLIADTARVEGVTLGLLQAADEIEKLLGEYDPTVHFTAHAAAWVRATREAAVISAADHEKEIKT